MKFLVFFGGRGRRVVTAGLGGPRLTGVGGIALLFEDLVVTGLVGLLHTIRFGVLIVCLLGPLGWGRGTTGLLGRDGPMTKGSKLRVCPLGFPP